ncbi:putative MAK10-like protein, amino-acid N-acetyltransferase subunit [Operophtera brumata]|uniref:Putative MAK10-like protein, amino-acid N-acetyltransferase subunit n=1 Tax=Operophtera brumata TaxID=104452 RepID=A0A0L7LGU8_OPEBR|nr:putative MAK10-like protein, amino-acid N-acetyltransferase subunit [Operophtera brumata]
MSAIEMMDPKMDAGMLCNRGGHAKPLNFQQAVAVSIIDATMACIVSWLEGHSLAQTVFTNLYLHQPHSIHDKTLKAYCIAIYKLLDCIRDCINNYGYRLGSNPQTGNTYDVSHEVNEHKCIGMLREQEEELNKKARTEDEIHENVLPSSAADHKERLTVRS